MAQDARADYSARVPSSPPSALVLGALRRLPIHALSRAAGRAALGPAARAAARARLPRVRARGGRRPRARCATRSPRSPRSRTSSRARCAPTRARSTRIPPRSWRPCDGSWGASGRIADGTLLQLKGRPYSLAALLGDEAAAKSFEGGWFATFYLAPRDYHRFHAPCDGVRLARGAPARLALAREPDRARGRAESVRRERAHLRVRAPARGDGRESLALVAVGATLVGKVHVTFDTLTTNTRDRAPRWRHYDPPPRLVKGGEWGRFEFGSTLVLAAAPGALELAPQPPGSPLRLGTRIGHAGAAAWWANVVVHRPVQTSSGGDDVCPPYASAAAVKTFPAFGLDALRPLLDHARLAQAAARACRWQAGRAGSGISGFT